MKPRTLRRRAVLWAILVAGTAFLTWWLWNPPGPPDQFWWGRLVDPGELSSAHAFLEQRCAACHTPVKGAEARNCVACHANARALLERQPTAFHATISSCRECHVEHLGRARRPTEMEHEILAAIGLQESGKQPESEKGLKPSVSLLDCAACHSKEDRHAGLFGKDCIACHSTEQWTIGEFRHPSPRSTDCVQCHQAPPSHFMEHFAMVSMRVAAKPHATVRQCHLCHRTTAWNDIRGVGWYDHH